MPPSALRFGLLSTASIGLKVAAAIAQAAVECPGTVASVAAVASRGLERAEAFASAVEARIAAVTNAPAPRLRAYGSYEELLADADVTAIYVPLPSAIKEDWAVRAARAGKHVLVEKPFVSAQQVEAIVAACRESGVQFLDGTMWVHHKRTDALKRDVLQAAPLGRLSHVTSSFTVRVTDETNIRLDPALEPLGALGDLGWYCTRAILWAFDYELPLRVRCFSTSAQRKVPMQCTAMLEFSDDRTASFDCSFNAFWRQDVDLAFPLGSVRMNDFVLPWASDNAFPHLMTLAPPSYTITREAGVYSEVTGERCCQEARMIGALYAATAGATTNERFVHEALTTQRVLDALVQSASSDGAAVALARTD